MLWIAFGIYILGVAIILFIRPNMMFRPGGWKEFGLGNHSNYTVFPFWMFTLVWAILSYTLATLGALLFASVTLRSVGPVEDIDIKPISQHIESTVPSMTYGAPAPRAAPPAPALRVPPVSERLPGYYILDTASRAAENRPTYMYYGTEPPSWSNVLYTNPR